MIKICALVDSKNVVVLQAINQYNVHRVWFDVGGMVVVDMVFLVQPPQWQPSMHWRMG
jgi:hypothetical protein